MSYKKILSYHPNDQDEILFTKKSLSTSFNTNLNEPLENIYGTSTEYQVSLLIN